MKERLTKKQERVFRFLVRHMKERGYPPTVREIAGYLGLSGPNGAKKFLDILERKKYIKRVPGSSRAIEVLHHPARREDGGRRVPVVGRIAAGVPILARENIEDSIVLDDSVVRWEGAFILRIHGDSMKEAHIMDNDMVLIKPQPMVENGEIAAVLIGDEATVKRFYKEKGRVRLEPANREMKPIIIKSGEVRVIGKVAAVIRYMV